MPIDFSKYKILAVDDIPANVLLLKVTLETAGFRVITAESAEEALTYLASEEIDLILLDVMMPAVSGFDLAIQLKQNTEYKDIPIIFLTALNSPSNIVKGFRLGAEDYIPKPFNKDELLARVSHQLLLLDAKRTILKREQELQKAIESRDKLYSIIAHDLRSPVSSLKMMLNAMSIKMQNQPLCKDMYDILQSSNQLTEQIFSLLDNLLKWTRSQLDELKPVPQTINLSDLGEGLVEIFSMVAKTKNIEIRFKTTSTEETIVFIDIDMIKTVIRNLLSNAIKFSYRDSEIEVEVSILNKEVIFKVSDHGYGINKDNQSKLLNIDTHYTICGTEDESGSGLGLLLSNKFIKMNGGRLFFSSEEHVGSTFGFILPRHEGQE